jgi:hypothetical protein
MRLKDAKAFVSIQVYAQICEMAVRMTIVAGDTDVGTSARGSGLIGYDYSRDSGPLIEQNRKPALA